MRSKNKNFLELEEGEGKRKKGSVMGIDVHRDIMAYCIVNEDKILKEAELLNNYDGINRLTKIIRRYKVISVAVESTAQYHFKLVFEMINNGIDILVANPQQTKTTQGKKTDKFDARRIAVAHRDGRLKPSLIPPVELYNLRKAVRYRYKTLNKFLSKLISNKNLLLKSLEKRI